MRITVSDLNAINIQSVNVQARPGATIYSAIQDAVRLAADSGENVTLNHNGRLYSVCWKDVCELVEKTAVKESANPESGSGFRFDVGQRVRTSIKRGFTGRHGTVKERVRKDAVFCQRYSVQFDGLVGPDWWSEDNLEPIPESEVPPPTE